MLKRIGEGFDVYKKSWGYIFKHPILLVPVVLAGAGVVYSIQWFRSNYDIEVMTTNQILFWLYIYTVVSTVLVSLASLIVLEYVEQIETDSSKNIFNATFDALTKDLIRALPIIIVWSIVKYVLLVLELVVMAAKAKEREKRKNSGRIFRSYKERRLSRSSSFLETLQTGVRMGVMIMLSAVAWEPIGPFKAAQKGSDVYKYHFAHMGTGVALSRVTKALTIIPVALFLSIYSNADSIPWEALYGALIYISVMSSTGMLVEQIYTAELYLWYKTYEIQRREYGKDKVKTLYDVSKPSLFDTIPDLL